MSKLFHSIFLKLCQTDSILFNYAKWIQFCSIMPNFFSSLQLCKKKIIYAKLITFWSTYAKVIQLCLIMPTYQVFPKLSQFFYVFFNYAKVIMFCPISPKAFNFSSNYAKLIQFYPTYATLIKFCPACATLIQFCPTYAKFI